MSPTSRLGPHKGWSSDPVPPLDLLGVHSLNYNTAEGYAQADKGYAILRHIQATVVNTNKGGGSFTHRHTDGTQWPFYWFDGEWFKEDTAAVTSLVDHATDTFVPTVVNMSAPAGVSVGFIGDNTKASGFRKETELETFLFDMDVIGGSTTFTPATSGGSLPDGTYFIAVTQIDTTGARTVESRPIFSGAQVVSGGGGSGSIAIDVSSSTFAVRAVSYRVYLSTSADAASAYFKTGVDTAKASSFTVTSTTVGVAIPQRANLYQNSKLVIDAVDSAVLYQGRLIYASSGSPYVCWSERDDINQFYATNSTDQVEGEFNGLVQALGATADAVYVFTPDAVHMITGDFGRDATGAPRIDLHTIETGVGCVSRGTVVPIAGLGLFFMSQFGPCVCIGPRVIRLEHDRIADYLDTLDFTYADRWTAAYNARLRTYEIAVTRLVNSTRPPDGAANAGICDRIIRWNIDEATYSPPRGVEVTHLSQRPHPGTEGGTALVNYLTAVGPHGSILRLGHTYTHGVEGDVSGTNYDAKAATTFGATSAVVTLSGITDQALRSQGVVISYANDDTGYPDVKMHRTIKTNTTSGSDLTIVWVGNVPTAAGGANPSIRLAGFLRELELRSVQMSQNPEEEVRVDHVTGMAVDKVGQEARS